MTVKALATAVAVTVALFLAWTFCYWPYRCNRLMKPAQARALGALDSRNRVRAALIARDNAVRVDACIHHVPSMLNLYMIAALNRRVVGQYEEAIALYERALTYDRRPEIYFQLGIVQLEAGRREDARRSLDRAVQFDPTILEEIPDDEMRSSLTPKT